MSCYRPRMSPPSTSRFLHAPSARCAGLVAGLVAACGGSARPTVAPAPVESAAPATPAVAPTARTPAVATPAAEAPAPVVAATGSVAVMVRPQPAYVELTTGAQLVNCDLVIENGTATDLRLDKIEVSVLDGKGALAWRKFLDGNGISPSITTIPNRDVGARQRVLLLNPLWAFPRDLELARLRYELTFVRTGGAGTDAAPPTVATVEVKPVVYANRAKLQLPLPGRMIVWDGHDFFSHHRRWDYLFAPIQALGFDSNAMRYSYDLVPVDAAGEMLHGDPAKNESWIGFGQPIYATAAGTVVAVVGDKADDHQFDMEMLKTDLRVVFGNYVVIDHGGGEHSLFGHLKQGSAKVAVGARVTAGQELAAIGASGSSIMPHLHYQLQSGPDGHAEGLPSYFHDYRRVLGSRSVAVKRGQIDSGDLLERAPAKRGR